MNSHLRKLSEDIKNNREDFRPISAAIKHPNLFKFTNNKTNQNTEFPNLFAKKNQENNKKFPNTIVEKV